MLLLCCSVSVYSRCISSQPDMEQYIFFASLQSPTFNSQPPSQDQQVVKVLTKSRYRKLSLSWRQTQFKVTSRIKIFSLTLNHKSRQSMTSKSKSQIPVRRNQFEFKPKSNVELFKYYFKSQLKLSGLGEYLEHTLSQFLLKVEGYHSHQVAARQI